MSNENCSLLFEFDVKIITWKAGITATAYKYGAAKKCVANTSGIHVDSWSSIHNEHIYNPIIRFEALLIRAKD